MVGFQAFIDGTSFDVMNAMSFNFVIDIIIVTPGPGSRAYSGPSMRYTAVQIGLPQQTGSLAFTYSQNGNTLSWNTTFSCTIVVFASPTSAAPYEGFQLYQPDGSVKIAPNYVPITLCQVIDFTPSRGQVIQTNVPYGRKYIAFHRATGAQMSQVLLDNVTANGYNAVRVTQTNGTPIRIYVFSDTLVNVPAGGFFMYYNNSMVWHSNCLPLNMKSSQGQVTSSTPVAVIGGLGANLNITSSSPGYYDQLFLATSAGQDAGTYKGVASGWEYVHNFNVTGGAPPSWTANSIGYIETSVYDTYYKQALGV